ncbi:exported protein [Enhygromyxa salina]|uniref:Murein endopeptidase K n=1 Tax=Enhygromyxa salina TaxID=215803 RepID=A0A0C2CZE5_9BACT|nr:DUF882 domain-containing protein [Enhygromyxa salina]KIG13212.1 exported protein [Enhygromyxa salina]
MLTLALAAVLAQAPPDSTASKKDSYLADKQSARAGKPARAGQRADQPVWANNLRTHEIRALTGPSGIAEDQRGEADRSAFFRCWFTHGQGPIPAALVARIVATAAHFDVREVRIISGYRAPKYNLLLAKKGHEVANNSQHTEANAIDFFLPGVETRALYDWLLGVHPGGVGFYPVSEFVHIDLGRKRTWRGT